MESAGAESEAIVDSVAGITPPVHRRNSKRPATSRYEEVSPAMEMDMMPLNAVAEPILTSARMHAIRVVAVTEYTGIEVLVLI